MPRRRKEPATATPTPGPTGPHVIVPNAVYTVLGARAALALTASTVRREVREGRLRIARRAGRYYILGAWLLEWLEAGEVKRSAPKQAATETSCA